MQDSNTRQELDPIPDDEAFRKALLTVERFGVQLHEIARRQKELLAIEKDRAAKEADVLRTRAEEKDRALEAMRKTRTRHPTYSGCHHLACCYRNTARTLPSTQVDRKYARTMGMPYTAQLADDVATERPKADIALSTNRHPRRLILTFFSIDQEKRKQSPPRSVGTASFIAAR